MIFPAINLHIYIYIYDFPLPHLSTGGYHFSCMILYLYQFSNAVTSAKRIVPLPLLLEVSVCDSVPEELFDIGSQWFTA
jgi:hypothetical protein